MRHVVVTGGGAGIGRATAAAFANSGAEVVITGRRTGPLADTAAQLGGTVRAVPFDAADPAQVEHVLADLPATVHVLVNNAGGNTDIGAREPGSLAEVAKAWQANLDANLLSAVLVTTALRDRLAPGGAIINLSSIAAHRSGAGSYAAAKAAVEAWNLTLAGDVGADRITARALRRQRPAAAGHDMAKGGRWDGVPSTRDRASSTSSARLASELPATPTTLLAPGAPTLPAAPS